MCRPYWFNGGLNAEGRLALAEWEALPADLQPLLRHWLSKADREPSAVHAMYPLMQDEGIPHPNEYT